MRLTNVMMTNTTLMHINRNMRNLDSIIRTIETGKRIQRPSDDPIIASRSLMFRTSVHENEQFQRNVDQGFAWMNVTETTFNNINKELLFEIRNLAVQGANGDNSFAEKQIIVQQMQALFDQIGHEMNATFGGNYLFSGFRTDEPPVFTSDNQRSFVITQHFNLADISREMSFQRVVREGGIGMPEPVSHNVHVLKLAFTGLSGVPVVPGFEVREYSIDDANAYLPPSVNDTGLPVLHFIPETGELVLHPDTAENFPREGVSVTFHKQGFHKGDINPAVYFTSREIVDAAPVIPAGTQLIYNITQYFSRAASIGTVMAGGVEMLEFELVFPPYDTANAPDLAPQLPPGAVIDGNIVRIPAHLFETQFNISVTYPIELDSPHLTLPDPPYTTHIMEDLRVQGVQLVRALNVNGVSLPLDQMELNRSFDMHNQNIEYEFASRTRIAVNSLAKNVFTDKMFADFRRFFEFSDAIHLSSETDLRRHFRDLGYEESAVDNAVVAQLDRESSIATYGMHRQFDNMLFLIDRHLDNSTREQTALGARMVRMELIQSRLEEDEVTYTLLTSDNEDTDLIRATIMRFSAEALFMASLRANSGVIQMSLANFLR